MHNKVDFLLETLVDSLRHGPGEGAADAAQAPSRLEAEAWQSPPAELTAVAQLGYN
ncbi:MAG TPA: hypothetical protein VI279_02335 [Rhodocyclaceae bacterium]